MADNEERITVLVLKNPCEKCDIKPCTRKCMFRTLFEKASGITRQEAIKILAIGWCSANGFCEECSDGKKGSKRCLKWLKAAGRFNEAEAALSALLGRCK